jgi:putative transposase
LEDRSRRPKTCRRRTWTPEQVRAVQELREQYPRWGKDKLGVLLRQKGVQISVSMIGRILAYLKRTRQLVEPLPGRISTRKRITRRPHAIRKPKDYRIAHPGDLVEVDTLDVRPVPNLVLKHFTARDVVARWDVVELHRAATAVTAAQFLEHVLAEMPFPVKAIQVDGGSEFMAEFEESCQRKGLKLFALPPRSPKLNGSVERAQRTHTEEFYELSSADPTVAALGAELKVWQTVYNTIRPHQALGYLTPLQFVTQWKEKPARKEAV